MKESIQSIAQWHAETFPDETQLGQLLKFKDEKKEWKATLEPATPFGQKGDIMELADMFIVAAGLTRFHSVEAMFAFYSVNDELCNTIHSTKELEEAIDAKMQINRARHWNKLDGRYQHITEE